MTLSTGSRSTPTTTPTSTPTSPSTPIPVPTPRVATPSPAIAAGDAYDKGSTPSTPARMRLAPPPPPGGPAVATLLPIDPAGVPDAAALASATPSARAILLGRLSATQRATAAMTPGADKDRRDQQTRAAIGRVIDTVPDGRALRGTLEAAAKNGTLGAVTEAVGLQALTAAGTVRGENVNDVLATSDTVKERGLTTYERGQIERNFNNTLDPDSVRFKFSVGVQTLGAGAMVIGNAIHVDPTDPRWGFAPGSTQPANPQAHEEYNQTLLAHEPTHVWSYQHQGSRYAINSVVDQSKAIATGADRNGAYGYVADRADFTQYGEEQRAMIVQDHVAAQRAQRAGASTVFLPGQRVTVSVQQALSSTGRFIEQMRAAGPGNPLPAGTALPVSHGRTNGQDGVADAVARNLDALVAGAGTAAVDAVGSGQPLKVAAGAAGIAAVVAGSLLTREQNAGGASSGGSALLDQAGIPRGVEVAGTAFGADVTGAARLGYDAGKSTRGLGLSAPANVRVELTATATKQLGDTSLKASASAEVGLDGSLRQAAAALNVQTPSLSTSVRGSYDGRGVDDVAGVAVDVQGKAFGVQAAGTVRYKPTGGVQAATVSGRVDGVVDSRFGSTTVSVDGSATFGANWQFASADLTAQVRQPGWSVSASSRFGPAGLDAIGAGVSAKLGTDGASVQASGLLQPASGASRFRLGVVIPLRR